MIYRYIIFNPADASVRGTNDRDIAEDFSTDEESIVVDSEHTLVIENREYSNIKEV